MYWSGCNDLEVISSLVVISKFRQKREVAERSEVMGCRSGDAWVWLNDLSQRHMELLYRLGVLSTYIYGQFIKCQFEGQIEKI